MNDMNMPRPDANAARSEWLQHMRQVGEMHGFFDRVGRHHHALYVQEGDTLLVTFDELGRVMREGQQGLPVGFDAVSKREWSYLSLVADGATWFRDDALYRFFDRLIDEGFFDSFEKVIFFGAGPMCGHAAAAYSVAAEAAQVVALSPVVSLKPETAPFEIRFRNAWRKDFSHHFGDAAKSVATAAQAVIVYDPCELLDAAHAAQFRGRNVTRLRFRGGGRNLLRLLEKGGNLDRVLKATANGRMTPLRFSQITRQLRQSHPDYLKRLLLRAEERGGTMLPLIVAQRGLAATGDAHFARAMMTLEAGGPPSA